MEKTISLIKQLRENSADIPHLANLSFEKSDHFEWNHETLTITYDPDDEHANAYLLHEYGHAMLNHSFYNRDIELIAIERGAWAEARTLATGHDLTIGEDIVEDSLDSYRDWMHSRSLCPHCNATGIQVGQLEYSCLACQLKWKVNQARTCALKRYKQNKNSAN